MSNSISLPNKLQLIARSISKRGFTLLEMVVTLSIIAILVAAISSQFSGDATKAAKILVDAEAIKKATLRMKVETGSYPCDIQMLWDRSDIPTMGCYLSRDAKSKWSGPYIEKMENTLDNTPSDKKINVITHGLPFGGLQESGSSKSAALVVFYSIPESVSAEIWGKCLGESNVSDFESVVSNQADIGFTKGPCHMAPDWGGVEGTYTLFYLISVDRY